MLVYGLNPNGLIVPLQLDAVNYLRVNATGSTVSAALTSFPASARVQTQGNMQGIWYHNPLNIGYGETVEESLTITNLAAGNTNIDFTAVGALEIHVITNIAAKMRQSGGTVRLIFSRVVAGTAHALYGKVGIVAHEYYDRQGQWLLKEGDNVRVQVIGATAGDDLDASIVGYKFYLSS